MIGFRANVLDAIDAAEAAAQRGASMEAALLAFLGAITDRTVSVERLMAEVEECE